LQLEQRIFAMRQHLSQFVRVMNDQLQREYDDLKTSDRFIGALNDALEYVAETQGFALIIRRNADLLYWDPDIDLTDEVIAELDRQAARR
jgi:outer membrane protein